MDIEGLFTGAFGSRAAKHLVKSAAPALLGAVFAGFTVIAAKFPLFADGDAQGDAVVYMIFAGCLGLFAWSILSFMRS